MITSALSLCLSVKKGSVCLASLTPDFLACELGLGTVRAEAVIAGVDHTASRLVKGLEKNPSRDGFKDQCLLYCRS